MGDKFAWQKLASREAAKRGLRDQTFRKRRKKKRKGAKDMLMPFGMYKGTRIDRVPVDYLQWLTTRPLNPDLKYAVEDALRQIPPKEMTDETR